MVSAPAAAAPSLAAAARLNARPMLKAALAGAGAVLAFAPFGLWPLQLLSLAYLFYQCGRDTSWRRAALLGWAYGFGWSVAGMAWLYVAMHRFGGLPAVLAALAVGLLGAYMGLFGAGAMGCASALRRRWSLSVPAFMLLATPAAWGLSEWLRGALFTGFPWVSTGYAHSAAPLGGFAALTGVYGIGLLAAVCAGCVAMLTGRARAPAAIVLCALLGAGVGLSAVSWTRAEGKPITVRLLQGNVAQDEKFDAAHIDAALALYHDMIVAAPADLIATPETAIVLFPQQLPPDYLLRLGRFAVGSGSALLFGMPMADGPARFSNSVAGIGPSGEQYRYDKHHLVPFGEFVPAGFRWFVDLMRIPLGDFQRGAAVQAPFAVRDQAVLPNICYEDLFGEEIADQLRRAPRPATILLNASNLAWYGESTAIPQHLQISQMRARETGRPMLRSTNNGATAVIDERGAIVAALPPYTRGTLAATVQGMSGLTPYVRFGNLLFLGLAALALAAAWATARIKRKTRQA